MRNEDVHIGLDKAEVRDIIAQGLIASYEKEASVYTYIPRTRLEQAQEKLRIAQLNVEAIKEQEGYFTIMKTFGWEEHDVSDETILTPGSKYFLSFIGTQEEYHNILEKIADE